MYQKSQIKLVASLNNNNNNDDDDDNDDDGDDEFVKQFHYKLKTIQNKIFYFSENAIYHLIIKQSYKRP